MPDRKPKSSKTVILSISLALALWLVALLTLVSWYQARYISGFTEHNPLFLQAKDTQTWFSQLTPLLPPKTSGSRVIQFWKPDCLCNRFARPHAISAVKQAKSLGIEHITIIPASDQQQLANLQALNPDTRIISLASNLLDTWPSSPSLLLEDPLGRLIYFGPLGFGAFCGQASTSVINSQMTRLQQSTAKPFYNVLGKGCFCPWK